MGELVDVNELAAPFLEEIRAEVAEHDRIRLVGIMGTSANASDKYAGYAASGCAKVGIEFELRHAKPEAVEPSSRCSLAASPCREVEST